MQNIYKITLKEHRDKGSFSKNSIFSRGLADFFRSGRKASEEEKKFLKSAILSDDVNEAKVRTKVEKSIRYKIKRNTGASKVEGDTTIGGFNEATNNNYQVQESSSNLSKLLHTNLVSSINKNNQLLLGSLKSSSTGIDRIAQFQQNVQANFYKTTIEYQNKVMSSLDRIQKTLMVGFNIDPKTGTGYKEEETKSTILDKLFFKQGRSGFKEGIQDVIKGIKENSKNNLLRKIPGGEMLPMLLGFMDKDMIKMMGPKLLMDAGMSWLMGKNKGGKGTLFFDFFNDPNKAASRLYGSYKGNPMAEFLASIFGVSKSGIDIKKHRTMNDMMLDIKNGDKKSFDGYSYKTLNVVIPELLSLQLAALTGKERIVYDYSKNTFVSAKEASKNMDKAIYSKNLRNKIDISMKGMTGSIQRNEAGEITGLDYGLLKVIKDILQRKSSKSKLAKEQFNVLNKWYKDKQFGKIYTVNQYLGHLIIKNALADDMIESENELSSYVFSFLSHLRKMGKGTALNAIVTKLREARLDMQDTAMDDKNIENLGITIYHILLAIIEDGDFQEDAKNIQSLSSITADDIRDHNNYKPTMDYMMSNTQGYQTYLYNGRGAGSQGSGSGSGSTNIDDFNLNSKSTFYTSYISGEAQLFSVIDNLKRRDHTGLITIITRNNAQEAVFIYDDKIYTANIADYNKYIKNPKTKIPNWRGLPKVLFGNGLINEINIKALLKIIEAQDTHNDSLQEDLRKYNDPRYTRTKSIFNMGFDTTGFKTDFKSSSNDEFKHEALYEYYLSTKLGGKIPYMIISNLVSYETEYKKETGKEPVPGDKNYIKFITRRFMKNNSKLMSTISGLDEEALEEIVTALVNNDPEHELSKAYFDKQMKNDKFSSDLDDNYRIHDYGTRAGSDGGMLGKIFGSMTSREEFQKTLTTLINDKYSGKTNAKRINLITNALASVGGLAAGEGIVTFGAKLLIRNKLLRSGIDLEQTLRILDDNDKMNEGKTAEQRESEKADAEHKLITQLMGQNMGSAMGAKVGAYLKHNLRFGGPLGFVANLAISTVMGKIAPKLLQWGGKGITKLLNRWFPDFDPFGYNRREALRKRAAESANKVDTDEEDQEETKPIGDKTPSVDIKAKQEEMEKKDYEEEADILNVAKVNMDGETAQKFMGEIAANASSKEVKQKAKKVERILDKTQADNAKEEKKSLIKEKLEQKRDGEEGSSGGLLSKLFNTLFGKESGGVLKMLGTSVGSLIKGGVAGVATAAFIGFAYYSITNIGRWISNKLGALFPGFGFGDQKGDNENRRFDHIKDSAKAGLLGSLGRYVAQGVGNGALKSFAENSLMQSGKTALSAGAKEAIKDAVGKELIEPKGFFKYIQKPLLKIGEALGKWLGNAKWVKKVFGNSGLMERLALSLSERFAWLAKKVARQGSGAAMSKVSKFLYGTSSMLATNPVTGLISLAISGGFLVWGFVSGWRNAYKYFNVAPDECTYTMKVSGALAKGVAEAIPALIPANPVVSIIIGTAAGVLTEAFAQTIFRFLNPLIGSGDTSAILENANAEKNPEAAENKESGDPYKKTETKKTTSTSPNSLDLTNVKNTSATGGSGYGMGSTVYTFNDSKGMPTFVSQKDFSNISLGGVNATFNGCALACAKMIVEYYHKEINDRDLISLAEKFLLEDKSISTDFFGSIKGSQVDSSGWFTKLNSSHTSMIVVLVNINGSNHFMTIFKRGNDYYIGDPMKDNWERFPMDSVARLNVKHARTFTMEKGTALNLTGSQTGGSGWGLLKKGFDWIKDKVSGSSSSGPQNTIGIVAGPGRVTSTANPTGVKNTGSFVSDSLKWGNSGIIKNSMSFTANSLFGNQLADNITGGDPSGLNLANGGWMNIANNLVGKIAVPSDESKMKDTDMGAQLVLKMIGVASKLDINAQPASQGVDWCAAFVTYCLLSAGVKLSSAINALWSRYPAADNGTNFVKLTNPTTGAIVVWQHGDSEKGHVAFVVSVGDDGSMTVLGGNQSVGDGKRGVTITTLKDGKISTNSKILGFYWPKSATTDNSALGATKMTLDQYYDNAHYSMMGLKYNFSKVKTGISWIDNSKKVQFMLSNAYGALDAAKAKGYSHALPWLAVGTTVNETGLKEPSNIEKHTNSPFNIRANDGWLKKGGKAYKGFRAYNNYQDAFLDFYRLISEGPYDKFRKSGNIADFMNTYSPKHENDTARLIKALQGMKNDLDKLGQDKINAALVTGKGTVSKDAALKTAKEVLNALNQALPDVRSSDSMCGIYALAAMIVVNGMAKLENIIDLFAYWYNKGILDDGLDGSIVELLDIYPNSKINQKLEKSPVALSSIVKMIDKNSINMIQCTKNGVNHWVALQFMNKNTPLVYDNKGKSIVNTSIEKDILVNRVYTSHTSIVTKKLQELLSTLYSRKNSFLGKIEESFDSVIGPKGSIGNIGKALGGFVGSMMGSQSSGAEAANTVRSTLNNDGISYMSSGSSNSSSSGGVSSGTDLLGNILGSIQEGNQINNSGTNTIAKLLESLIDVSGSISKSSGRSNDLLTEMIEKYGKQSTANMANMSKAQSEENLVNKEFNRLKKTMENWKMSPGL